MAVPINLVGAWHRSGLIVDGARQVDHCEVLWLQSPTWFADIRLRRPSSKGVCVGGLAASFARERCFAGLGTWVTPRMTWIHLLDSEPSFTVDTSRLTWEAGVLLERGILSEGGATISFIEEWECLTEYAVALDVRPGHDCLWVSIDRWAVDVRDERPGGLFVAHRYERIGSTWDQTGALHRTTGLAPANA